jgi:hypothetical protein
VVGRAVKVEICFFYSSGAWESNSLGSVADGGGADSMPRFWLEKGGDGTKCCRKMKWRQRSHFDFMRMNHDMARLRDDINRRRCGTRDEK